MLFRTRIPTAPLNVFSRSAYKSKSANSFVIIDCEIYPVSVTKIMSKAIKAIQKSS